MMDVPDGYMLQFKPKSEKARRRWRRRTPNEKERTLTFGLFSLTVSLWDKEDWLDLPNRPKFRIDFGDIVVSFSLSCWPEDWPP